MSSALSTESNLDTVVQWEVETVNEEVSTTETEIICGVGDDCIRFPHNNIQECIAVPEVQEQVVYQQNDVPTPNLVYGVPQEAGHSEFWEIQVAQEEVVGDSWVENGQVEVGETVQVGFPVEQKVMSNSVYYEKDEVEIPLPQDQDSYTTMRPYPCDFCSRRFRKKANLMNHMIAHQSDRPHGCNLCGARYRRKSELIIHLKIHAYAPGQLVGSSDEFGDAFQQDDSKVKGRRKKPVAPKKRKDVTSNMHTNNKDYFKDAKKNNAKKNHASNSAYSYVDEDMKLMRQTVHRPPQPPRWPITDSSRPYVCQHCGVAFAREKALASHSRIHAGDSPFECTTCGEMFWDLNVLREHSSTKHGITEDFPEDVPYTGDDRFGEFHCDSCGLSFHRHDLLMRHRRIHMKTETSDGENNSYVCQVCSQTFTEQADLLAHVETHARYQPHRCMLCGECFMDSPAVAEHVRRRHAKNIPPNACTLCGKTCKDRRSLQKHSWVHSVERSFSCFKCGKRFHSRARLKRHMVSHRDKAVACEECGEEFPDGRALMNHRHSHTKDVGTRQFHCVECGKTFGSRSSQQIHARIHTGERPYGCRFCWKAFADGGTLRKHERIHTGEKPYACPVCPRAFNQRVVLREHIRSHHSGPEPKMNTNHMAVFMCKVCAASFGSSEELCAHLVSHSDENTAKHRTPRLGPRKYKRRRKLNPQELHLMASGSDNYDTSKRSLDSDEDVDDDFNDDDLHDDPIEEEEESPKIKLPIIKKKVKQKKKSSADDNFQTVVKTFESVVENFNSFVDSATSDNKKSKRKHRSPQKQKSSVVDKVGSEMIIDHRKPELPHAGGFIRRAKPSGQPRIRPRTKNVSVKTLAALKAVNTISNSEQISEISKAGPRTKNVNYHNVKMAKLTPATFPRDSKAGASKSSKAKPVSKSRTPSPKKKSKRSVVSPRTPRKAPATPKKTVNSPKKPISSPKKATISPRRVTNSRKETTNSVQSVVKNAVGKSSAKSSSAPTVPPESSEIEIKKEYVCEMCSETFTKRSELLIHVPIHI